VSTCLRQATECREQPAVQGMSRICEFNVAKQPDETFHDLGQQHDQESQQSDTLEDENSVGYPAGYGVSNINLWGVWMLMTSRDGDGRKPCRNSLPDS
jgi:hypothetical protein